jgi:hypothetical protein
VRTQHYSSGSLLERLREIDRWLAALQVKRGASDRLHQITQLVTATESARSKAQKDELPVLGNFDNYIYAMAEALEFCQIYDAFNEFPANRLAPKIERALDGPFRVTDETNRSSVGRNTIFELALAAEWQLRGADVEIGEPDITLRIGTTNFVVECKRPLRVQSIQTNLRNARDQLASRLGAANPRSVGVIAISVSRIFTKGTSLYLANSERNVAVLGEKLDAFLNTYKKEWYTLRMDRRIAAVLFHLSIPTDVADHDHFALLSTSNVYQATNDRSHLEILHREMDRQYGDLESAQ